MACVCARQTDQWHGWKCEITDGECMFLFPDSKACAEKYGEGPDAYIIGVDLAKGTDMTIETIHHIDRGRLIGYTEEECSNCGRVRVELCGDGSKICEKCKGNQEKGEYEKSDY